MSDLPFWTAVGRAARVWGLAAAALAVAGIAAADWAASRYAAPADDLVTGSVAPPPKARAIRVIRSVLSDEPIVIRQ